jgi:hypothetical protein
MCTVSRAICSGVYRDQQNYFFFDSHSHSKSGLYNPVEPSGTSILIAFSNIEDLVGDMYSFYTSMQIDLLTQFEILPLSIKNFFLYYFLVSSCLSFKINLLLILFFSVIWILS